jgi:HK97 family phage major capsid protein
MNLVDTWKKELRRIKLKSNQSLADYKRAVDLMIKIDEATKPEKRMYQPDGFGETGEKNPFRSLGEQLQAVAQSSKPGARIDEKLYQVRSATGMSESVPSDGGFLVQPDFANDIFESAIETGELAKRCNRIPITGNRVSLNAFSEESRATGSRFGGIRGYWADEATEITASKPKLRQIELKLHKLVGLCYATDELLEDASALESVIRTGFREEFAFMLDDAIVNGNGAGQPLGILNAGCLVTQAAEDGQSANTVNFHNLTKMYSRMLAEGKKNGYWLINSDIIPQLYSLALEGVTGGIATAFLPKGGLSDPQYDTLFGRPIVEIEQCQTLGTTGDIVFANLNKYLLADKGVQSAMSIHVRFIYDESVFRFVLRVDGQPFLRKAITPFKSSATLSDFIALATRSE